MLQVPLENKYAIPFMITSLLYNMFDYGVHHLTLLATAFNLLHDNHKTSKQITITETFAYLKTVIKNHAHLHLLFHLIFPLLIQFIQKQYIQFITNKIAENCNALFIDNETYYLLNNKISEVRKLYLFTSICEEQIELYIKTCSQVAKFFIASIIIAIDHKLYGIALPIGYFIILKILNYMYTDNNELNKTNQKRMTNYLIFSYFFIVFPILLFHTDHYNVISMSFYCFVIITIDFKSLNTLNINNQNISNTLKNTKKYNSDKIGTTLSLYSNTDNISIREYFHLYRIGISDHTIIEILDELNLIPELYKINPHILDITMNNSQINTYLNTKIGIARIMACDNPKMINMAYKHIDPDGLKKHEHLIDRYNFIKV
jgi:hypothetical protein